MVTHFILSPQVVVIGSVGSGVRTTLQRFAQVPVDASMTHAFKSERWLKTQVSREMDASDIVIINTDEFSEAPKSYPTSFVFFFCLFFPPSIFCDSPSNNTLTHLHPFAPQWLHHSINVEFCSPVRSRMDTSCRHLYRSALIALFVCVCICFCSFIIIFSSMKLEISHTFNSFIIRHHPSTLRAASTRPVETTLTI